MKFLALLSALFLCGCKESSTVLDKATPEESEITSVELQQNFPLLPLIEPILWKKLTQAEAEKNQPLSKKITTELQQLHPFTNAETTITLGGIIYHKSDKKITIPATVNYPSENDTRHPQEIELILCNNQGRTHETLFTTDVNPLHLELLLHLTGSKKAPEPSRFKLQIQTSDQTLIPIRKLLQTTEHKPLPQKEIFWEFSGSDISNNFYQPESTGDLIICWHVHQSVLRITEPQIGSSEIKLLPVRQPNLKQGQKVMIVLTPVATSS